MEEQLLKEAIEVLKNNKRPEFVECPIYGQYTEETKTFIYDDSSAHYKLNTEYPQDKDVRSVKAFAELIKEELRRRENPTGNKATVKINLGGGYFIPDDNFGRTKTTFQRLNSQQWNIVKNGINKDYDHKSFLKFLQSLRPSIEDFQDLFRRFATLRMVGETQITSNPIFTEDGQNSGYTCRYKLEDGCDGEDTFPGGFDVEVQFAKAGDKTYTIPIDLLFYRDEYDNIRIETSCPLFENIEEQAILDEANYIKQELSDLSELLVLSDF